MTVPQNAAAIQRRLVRVAVLSPGPLAVTVMTAAVGAIVVVAQMAVAAQLVVLAFPTESGREASPLPDRRSLLAALVVFILLRALAAAAGELAAQRTATRAKSRLRQDLVRSVVLRGPHRRDGDHTGEVVTTAIDGVEKLDAFYRRFYPQAIATAIVPIVILVAVAAMDPLSGVILAVTGPLIPLFMWLLGSLAERRAREQWRALGMLGGRFLDTLQGLPTLTQFNRQHDAAASLDTASELLRTRTMGVLKVAFLSGAVLELAASVSTALVAAGVGVRLIEGTLTFLPGLTVLLLAPEFYLPFRQLGQRHHAGMEGIAAAERIFELMNPGTQPVAPQGIRSVAPGEGRLEIAGLKAGHPGAERPALIDFSLSLRPRTLTAIVGPSGAGKSTLLAVLMRFVEPTAGAVYLNGQAMRTTDPAAWRLAFAYVPQRPRFIHGSILDNMRLAKPDATIEEVVTAARLAGADDFIAALPQAYETVIDESTSALSGGERQRLAIARALLKPAPVLLLDEPTASLDRQTEALVIEAIQRISRQRTVLVAAHRLATVRHADHIAVLDGGRLAEAGTHRELMSKRCTYARLVKSDRQGVA